MEHELRSNLLACAEDYLAARPGSLATLGRIAAGDWRFFDRVREAEKTFTARKYDEVVEWFSANWPENAEWPAGVPRPAAGSQEAA